MVAVSETTLRQITGEITNPSQHQVFKASLAVFLSKMLQVSGIQDPITKKFYKLERGWILKRFFNHEGNEILEQTSSKSSEAPPFFLI